MLRPCIVVVLFICSVFASADKLKVVTSGGLQGVANQQGEFLVPAIYEKLGWSDKTTEIVGGSIGYLENGKWGIINIKSGKLSSARYATLEPFGERLYEAGIPGRFTNIIFKGLIDAKSKVHLDFNYYTIDVLSEYVWLVSEYNVTSLDYGVVSVENRRILPSKYRDIEIAGDLLLVKNKQDKFKLFTQEGNPLSELWMDNILYKEAQYALERQGYHGRANELGVIEDELIYKGFENGSMVDFPEWEVKKIGQQSGKMILCDSVIYNEKSDLLIAHVNKAEHILSISEDLFQDQQHSLKFIGKGFLITEHNITEKWSLYKTDGRLLAADFDSIYVDENYFYCQAGEGWSVFNLFGRKINARPIENLSSSHAGNIPIVKNEYWGWIDFQGERLITCRYELVQPSTNLDHFIASNYDRWGVRTFSDEWLIMPKYDSLFVNGDFYIGRKGQSYHVLDMEGQMVHQIPYKLVVGDLIRIENESLSGLLTSGGKYIYPEYEKVGALDNYYTLQSGSTTKLINRDNEVIISMDDAIEEVLSFAEGYFHIIKDQQHGFVDLNGKLRVANRYDSAQFFSEGLAPVKLRGNWGFVDKQETLVIQPYYSYASTFSNGLAIIKIDDLYGIIDPEGQEVIKPTWKKIERLGTGNYKVMDTENKEGLVNQEGRFILRPNYDSLTDSQKGLVVAERYGKKGILNYAGLTKIPFEYREIIVSGDYLILRKD